MSYEVQRRSLPRVDDGDPLVAERLLKITAAVVDGRVPGLGIIHSAEAGPNDSGVHHIHRGLILRALWELGVTVETKRIGPARDARGEYIYTPPHTDDGATREHQYADTFLTMGLRLNTASAVEGADIVLVNTAPGYYIEPGDVELYSRWSSNFPDELEAREYSNRDLMLSHEARLQIDDTRVGQDGIYCEPVVYDFAQIPNASVLIRAQSMLGPVSIHAFRSMDGGDRDFKFTQIPITGQSL